MPFFFDAGLPYHGLTKSKTSNKRQYIAPRSERKMGIRCECKLSKLKNTSLKCAVISDGQRQACFEQFWKMNWSEKKGTVRSLVARTVPRDLKHRKNEEVSRRKQTLKFHLKNPATASSESEKILRVCKKMFLNTLGLKEWTVLNWVKCRSDGDELQPQIHKRKVLSEKQRNIVQEFLNSLPKMESHYCRADTQRLYLEPVWESKQHIHREYVEYCTVRKCKPVQTKVFCDVMDEMKISMYRPRKDLCDLCLGYENKNPDITKEIYDSHILKKNEARNAMEADIANQEYKAVFTMDLEAVLVCPVTKASAAYYKSKLIVHNFTVYDCRTHQGFCYLWDESEADLQASVFATLIVKFLEDNVSVDEGDVIVLWSDGCCYQNRNEILANALLNFSINRKISIIQKYLEKGHTQMPCDSMHSKIERKCRRQEIYLPSTYITLCAKARQKPAPFQVLYCHHDYFLNYSKMKFYSSIRPGIKKGDPVVVDLRALKYNPEGTISYKLLHSGTWDEMKHRTRSPAKAVLSVPKLFPRRLSITAKKWTQIQELKHVLPRDTHLF
jgi:hypothetical protein